MSVITRRRVIWFVILLAAIGIGASLTLRPKPAAKPVPVSVVQPTLEFLPREIFTAAPVDLQQTLALSGALRAVDMASVKARLAADVREVMVREGDNWTVELPEALLGARYGFRASGQWNPGQGLWFDPSKLLVDPYAAAIDAPFRLHPDLFGGPADTAPLVPKSIVTAPPPALPRSPMAMVPSWQLMHRDDVCSLAVKPRGVPWRVAVASAQL